MPQDYVTRKRKKESLTDKYIPETIEKEYARSKNLEKSESFPREYLPQFQTDYVKRDAYIPQQPAQAAPVIPDFAAKLAAEAGAAGLPQDPTVVQPQAEQPQAIQGGQQGPLTSEADVLKGQLAGVEAEPEQRAKFAPEQLGQPPVGQPPEEVGGQQTQEGGVPWGDILLGATPTLIGYLFGGAEGAGLGAEIGGKALMDEAGRRQKKADETEQGIKATEAKTAERAADYDYWEKKQRATKEIAEPYEIAKEERALTAKDVTAGIQGRLTDRKQKLASDLKMSEEAFYHKHGYKMKPSELTNLKFENQKALQEMKKKSEKSQKMIGGFSKDVADKITQARDKMFSQTKEDESTLNSMGKFMANVNAEISPSDRAAIMAFARAAQGSGKLSNVDVEMFQDVGGVFTYMMSKQSEWKAGKLSGEARRLYKQAGKVLYKFAAGQYNEKLDQFVDSTTSLTQENRDDVDSVFGPFRKNPYKADLIEIGAMQKKEKDPDKRSAIKHLLDNQKQLVSGSKEEKQELLDIMKIIRGR